jgi:hypothetical protein
MADDEATRIGDDLIRGVSGPHGIAAELKMKPSAVYHLIRHNRLSGVVKLGHKTIIASRRRLRRQFAGELSK